MVAIDKEISKWSLVSPLIHFPINEGMASKTRCHQDIAILTKKVAVWCNPKSYV